MHDFPHFGELVGGEPKGWNACAYSLSHVLLVFAWVFILFIALVQYTIKMLKTKAMMICLASFIHGKMSPVLRGTWSGLWIILCCGLAHNTLALSFQETSSLRHTLHLYSSLTELKQQSHDPCDKTT